MITVIHQPESVTRCKTCSSILQYQSSDKQARTNAIYRGFFSAAEYETIRFIICPVCNNEVIL